MFKKRIGIFICTLVIAAVVLPATGTINEKVIRENKVFDNQTSMKFVPGEFIVKLKKDATFSNPLMKSLNEKHKVYALEKIFNNTEDTILNNIYLLHVPLESDILSIVSEYVLSPDVAYAEPNGILHSCGIPNDVNFSSQWNLDNTGQVFLVWHGKQYSGTPDADIDAPEVWDIETGSSDVVVAVIDTGIDYSHPDLAANIWNNIDEIPENGIDDDNNGYIDDVMGWDYAYNDNDPKDGVGHGTLCSGIIAAETDNNIGMAGVTWNCKIMPVQVVDDNDYVDYVNFASGIIYATDNGADICSISQGSYLDSNILLDAVNYAYEKGVFLSVAAGNFNSDNKFYPAAYDNVVAVAATNQYDERCTPKDWGPSYGSQYGDWVDIAAPGNLIFTTMPTYHVLYNDYGMWQNYDYGQGTSFSAPMVAGVAALLLSKNSSLSPNDLKEILCNNIDPYNSTEYIGTGRLNAQKALTALITSPNLPTINGPSTGKKDVMLEYTFNAIDPNNDTVRFIIDWGDGNSDTSGFNPSGIDVKVKHKWSAEKSYLIKVKAEDIYGNVSPEKTLSITIPRNRATTWNYMLVKFLEHFLLLERILNFQ